MRRTGGHDPPRPWVNKITNYIGVCLQVKCRLVWVLCPLTTPSFLLTKGLVIHNMEYLVVPELEFVFGFWKNSIAKLIVFIRNINDTADVGVSWTNLSLEYYHCQVI